MTALAGAQSCGDVIQHACRGRAVRRLSSYLLYDGYSFRDQTLSGRTIGSNKQFEPMSWISI